MKWVNERIDIYFSANPILKKFEHNTWAFFMKCRFNINRSLIGLIVKRMITGRFILSYERFLYLTKIIQCTKTLLMICFMYPQTIFCISLAWRLGIWPYIARSSGFTFNFQNKKRYMFKGPWLKMAPASKQERLSKEMSSYQAKLC